MLNHVSIAARSPETVLRGSSAHNRRAFLGFDMTVCKKHVHRFQVTVAHVARKIGRRSGSSGTGRSDVIRGINSHDGARVVFDSRKRSTAQIHTAIGGANASRYSAEVVAVRKRCVAATGVRRVGIAGAIEKLRAFNVGVNLMVPKMTRGRTAATSRIHSLILARFQKRRASNGVKRPMVSPSPA